MVLAGAEPDDGTMAAVMAAPKTMVLIITVIIIPSSHLGGLHFFCSTFLFRPSISTFIRLFWNWLGCCSPRLFIQA